MESSNPDAGPTEYPLTGNVSASDHFVSSTLSIQIRFVPIRDQRPASLIVLPGKESIAEWIELLRATGERIAPAIRVARIERPEGSLVLIRPAPKRKRLPFAAWPGTGYVAFESLPSLFLPTGFTLRPSLRPNRLASLFELARNGLTWLEPTLAGIRTTTISSDAFRPVSLKVVISKPVAFRNELLPSDPFPLEPFATTKTTAPARLHLPEPIPASLSVIASPIGEGWMDRIAKSLRKKLPVPVNESAEEPDRVSGLLASAEAMTIGPAGAAHRAELESRVLHTLPTMEAEDRAALWAELADAYSVRRRPSDAALCWLNAIWDSPTPPSAWFDRWIREEAHAARRTSKDVDLKSLLTMPLSVPLVRLAAAHFIRITSTNRTTSDWLPMQSRIVSAVEAVEADLPLRLVWLARTASTRLVNGDILSLARGRDSLLTRLKDGPALDRDAPAFLRFAGESGVPHETRDWLLRVRDPARRWVRRVTRGGSLQRFGLDGESEATSAYSDLLFAWAAGRLGERAATAEWSTTATVKLEKIGGPVHTTLLATFLARIREARDGRRSNEIVDIASKEAMSEFERFSVDKMRSQSDILEPYAKPANDPARSLPRDERTANSWTHQLPHRFREQAFNEREFAGVITEALAVSARWETVDPIAIVAEFLTGPDAPALPLLGAIFDRVGIPIFAAMRDAGFDATTLVRRLTAEAAAMGDVRSAVAAAGWLSLGRDDRGMERLDACRTRLYEVSPSDPRERTALAVATTEALGLASPRVALGRLEELFHRLEGIDVTGSTNRYFTLKPLLVIEAALRAAVGRNPVPGPTVRTWLAADERVILSRIAKDVREAGL